ncbi:hypothetical protein B9T62_31750 [Paenibacillus donghaensis]|uniref:Uncharacterized protein n=1 Tax=Paenibacillus donghaensis TaxID=414771 RepID=A0A2Z2KJV3_9BACL|nr:hypothetical protein B9T62_31750 [Paenibacillus donghaensis]
MWIRKPVFKAVTIGSPIFFLEKGSRLIRGFGLFEKFEINSTINCWNKYGSSNGAATFEEFLGALNFPNQEISHQQLLGCILVKNVVWSLSPLPINQLLVEFSKSTVSGKRINKDAVNTMLKSPMFSIE